MADAPGGTPSKKAVFFFTVLVLIIHVVDFLWIRRKGIVSWYVLIALAFIYIVVLGLGAKAVLKKESYEPVYWFGAMWAMPMVLGMLLKLVGVASVMGRILSIGVFFFPLFIIYFYKEGLMTGLITVYAIIWIFGGLFMYTDTLQNYAGLEGIEIPYNPLLTYEFIVDWTWNAIKKVFQVAIIDAPSRLLADIKGSVAAAKGDYYTGQVDSGAEKRLGVYLERFKTTETKFYEGSPVTAYVTMKAETLDVPLEIDITCDADPQTVAAAAEDIVGIETKIPADLILPQERFSILTSDQYDIDCIWNPGTLEKGSYKLDLKAEFDFTTRAYKKAYVMSSDRLREYRRQKVDPLEGITPKDPPAIYTSGPVRIGMGVGQQQPVSLGERGDTLQAWGITITNAWEGKIIEIKNIFTFIPEGLKISDPTGENIWTLTNCEAVPEEERVACEDTLVEVYRLSEEELAKPIYKDLTTKNIRVYVEIVDPATVIGTAPIAVQNFKSTIQYRYQLERSMTTRIVEVTS